MATLRKARPDDLDFLVEVDLLDDGYTVTEPVERTPDELLEHREKIAAFLRDPDKGAFVCEDENQGQKVAMIMYKLRSLEEEFAWYDRHFREIDRSQFPPDGRFLEIFQLWVAPTHRRQGLASALKERLEQEARDRGVHLIYTHTEEKNAVVLHLNQRLGYREVRRGPIWDEVIRVSLAKTV